MLRVAAAQASRRTAARSRQIRQVRQISTGRHYALFARRRFDRLAAATTASLESAAATPALLLRAAFLPQRYHSFMAAQRACSLSKFDT